MLMIDFTTFYVHLQFVQWILLIYYILLIKSVKSRTESRVNKSKHSNLFDEPAKLMEK
jgi:hypothetical protein